MFERHVIKYLSAHCHGELSIDKSRRVAEHLRRCERCQKEFEEIKLGALLARCLPRASAPASLWSEVERSFLQQFNTAPGRPKYSWFALTTDWRKLAVIGAMLVLGMISAWFYTYQLGTSWEVVRLEGTPAVGSDRIHKTGRLAVGEWLETDGASRAAIQVGQIGQVEIEPNTRVRLVKARLTEHRLALAHGTMHAWIWAPPRLFFVDTPSAVAVDLGCAYTLEVGKTGAGLLRVTSGWVAFERDGRESFVPAEAACRTSPQLGPGTPYFEDASETFQVALAKLDDPDAGPEARAAALDVVLTESRQRDALTLWHLLSRASDNERGRVYDRLAALVPPPDGVTREGIRRADKHMLDLWWDALGWGKTTWWRMWKGPWPQTVK